MRSGRVEPAPIIRWCGFSFLECLLRCGHFWSISTLNVSASADCVGRQPVMAPVARAASGATLVIPDVLEPTKA